MAIKDFVDKMLGKKEPTAPTKIDEITELEFGDPAREYKPSEDITEDTEKEEATFSNEDTKPTVKGFKKGAVYAAIGLVAFGATAGMVMHNVNSDSKPSSTQSSGSVGSGASASNGSVAGPDLGFDSYASMGQYENEKKIDNAVKGNKANASKPSTAGTQSVPQASGTYTVRQVPNRVGTGSYNATAPINTGGGTTAPATGGGLMSKNNPYASAIAFALGGEGIANASGDTSDGSSINNSVTGNDDDYGSYTTSDRVLLTGTLVPVTLITGIDSSLDGQITAQVREDVYDSITGSSVLIPAGSRLIGSYGGDGSMNAGRVSVKFTRIIFPDGNSVGLKDAIGVDAMGFGGVKDQYTEHTGKAVGASFITSLLAGIAGTASDGSGSDNRSSGQEAISDAISNVLNTGQEIVKKKLDVDATAIVRPGFEFNVILNSDLALDPYYGY